MREYLVKKDFTKEQSWTARHAETFGAHNEGFILVAEGIDEAKMILKSEYRYNPWYLDIKEVKK